jgi:hypothetical protein
MRSSREYVTEFNQLQVIDSSAEIQRVRALVADLIEDSGNFRADWLSENHWTVVPVESADHFLETDIELLASAFRKAGHEHLLALETERTENICTCYKLPTTLEGFGQLNEALRDFSFILMPEDRSCAVLCTKDDYYLVGGPLPFVILGLNVSISEARDAFLALAERNPHPGMKRGLLGTAARYDRGNEDAGRPGKMILPPSRTC